jgi:hypothetical protein
MNRRERSDQINLMVVDLPYVERLPSSRGCGSNGIILLNVPL